MERMAHVTLCLGQVLQEDIAKEFFFFTLLDVLSSEEEDRHNEFL